MNCVLREYYKIAGIYGILNKINNKIYIGSAVDLYTRHYNHLNMLNNNKHRNRHLQYAWNKYRENNFKFLILYIVRNKNDLILFEQAFMDEFLSHDDKYGYNIDKIAGNRLGSACSSVTRNKISNSLRITSRERGKNISEAKIRSFNKKIIQLNVNNNFIREHDSISSANYYLGISRKHSSIGECLAGRTKTAHKYKWRYKR